MTDKLRAAAEMALEALQKVTQAFLDTEGSHGQMENEAWDSAYEAASALRQALADPISMTVSELAERIKRGEKWQPLDTGIDRGAWADVPDATKWVDELRGDDEELPPVKTYCGGKPNYCQLEEPPNSTTDVVEREPFGWLFKQADGDLYKLLRGEDVKWHEKNNPSWIKVSPLYTAPPKREWQGLTDGELPEGSTYEFDRGVRWAEAKLKEKNT